MLAMEIHTIILIILAPMTRGLLQHLQNCSDYCKLLSNQYNNTRWDCDCSTVYQYKVKPTTQGSGAVPPDETEDKIMRNNHHYSSPHFEPKMYLEKTVSNSKRTDIEQNIFFKTKQYNRGIAAHRHRNVSQNSEQYLDDIITENEIPLYLDIDVYEASKNKTYQEVLGDVFENFRFIEKNLSECLNLHIFIFSKNNDNSSKTNTTNWGRNAKQYNKLSNSEVLTEIRNKCNQTGNIVEQSVYDIINWSETKRQSNYSKEALRAASHDSSKPFIGTGVIISHGSTTQIPSLYEGIPEAKNHVKSVITDDNMLKLKDHKNNTPKIQINNTTETKNNSTIVDKSFMEPLLISSGEQTIDILTKFNRSIEPTDELETSTDSIVQTSSQYFNDARTLPVNKTAENYLKNKIRNATSRAEYQEGEYLIPKVITKELSNNTVQSVVEGYEVIPNSDYIDTRTTPMVPTAERSQTVTELNSEQTIDFGQFTTRTVPQVNDVEIEGFLYFLYGKHQIPARFIQERDGNIHLAIDGFLLCTKILQQKHKSAFMSLLCKCIVLDNCT